MRFPMVIEVEVHSSLRAFLREQGQPSWPHHLTMARLVARALRLGRSALIQTGVSPHTMGRYRLSYLAPALLWRGPVIVVASEPVQQQLLRVEIPRLREYIQTNKAIRAEDHWPDPDFQGLLLTSPEVWLTAQLSEQGRFPGGIPTLIDGVDDLEEWAREAMTVSLQPRDWEALMLACPAQAEVIRDARVQLTKAVFQHPVNPYECCLIEPPEQEILRHLYKVLGMEHGEPFRTPTSKHLLENHPTPKTQPSTLNTQHSVPPAWKNFWHRWQKDGQLMWAEIARQQGQFSLFCSPVEVATALGKLWSEQPIVLIGGALDLETEAELYRQRVGLSDLTCLKFSPDRQNELIQLYLPDRLPMPNTPQFQSALMQEIRLLMGAYSSLSANPQGHRPAVLLVDDVPLKAQVGTSLAAEFGSRVQVEKTCLDENSILVTGWEFWRQHQGVLPAPHLLVIATLPIPSLENPLVAGRVAYYKEQHKDWFRLYLLPVALSELQRAIAPVRECQGVVALLDNRVNYRSYGQLVLAALGPLARINYLDPTWFSAEGKPERNSWL